LVPDLVDLEEHWILPRCPEPYGDDIWNPIDYYTEDVAKGAINKAEKVLNIITKFIREYYNIKL